jgi:Mrp family chromosome partitioning ATPase
MKENAEDLAVTQKLVNISLKPKEIVNGNAVPTRPLPEIVLPVAKKVSPRPASLPASVFTRREQVAIHDLQEQCRCFCLNTFLRKQDPVRCLGITSAIAGEGRSLLAVVMAQVLAADSAAPVVLVECGWEPKSSPASLTIPAYFAIPPHPGLAEWLLEECKDNEMSYLVAENLTVIPAGNSRGDAVKVLQAMQKMLDRLIHTHHFVIVDLPPLITTPYGVLAASTVEALALVVRAGSTPAALIREASNRLQGLQVEGVILNQMQSKIPRWLERIL